MSYVQGTTISSVGASDPIQINEDEFYTYIQNIATTSGTIIASDNVPVEPAASITKNATVPEYVMFDQRVEKVLMNLKTESMQVDSSLNKILEDYKAIDTDASSTIATTGSNLPASKSSSSSAGTGNSRQSGRSKNSSVSNNANAGSEVDDAASSTTE